MFNTNTIPLAFIKSNDRSPPYRRNTWTGKVRLSKCSVMALNAVRQLSFHRLWIMLSLQDHCLYKISSKIQAEELQGEIVPDLIPRNHHAEACGTSCTVAAPYNWVPPFYLPGFSNQYNDTLFQCSPAKLKSTAAIVEDIMSSSCFIEVAECQLKHSN